jgi:acyl-CoA thioester hydrolase
LIRFGYKIIRAADGLLLCEGETMHIVLGRDMKRRSIPKKYAELLSAAASHPQA